MVGRRRNGERGQAAVLLAILCFVLVLMIAFTTNLGKLVTEKMAMQNAVDLAVYSGAATQAGYLNKMREINHDIWKVHNEVREKFAMSGEAGIGNPFFQQPGIVQACGPIYTTGPLTAPQAEQFKTQKKMEIQNLRFDFQQANQAAPGASLNAARQAANLNFAGTGQSGRFNLKSPMSSALFPAGSDQIHWDYSGWSYSVCGIIPNGPVYAEFVTQDQADSWFYWDSDPGEILFAAGIENAAPLSPFVDVGSIGGWYFSKCSTGGMNTAGRCPMPVYAAAHPFFGKMGTMKSGPDASEWTGPSDDFINNPDPKAIDKNDLDDYKVRGGTYQDYQARFIGIFEQNANVLGGSQLLSQVPSGNQMDH